ncbi:hypothetical protein T440DRAFT_409117 [Plenodomus tracheiphilus IPT5]|uniref:PSI domain-containing protein n=1 Tax=Plenodomus tracheiphilus IPT5 TaxID=1408161 RepID=A0A6A7ANV0_9PLEO|nr:hypothetical protein T440DRAFT_409117 [Plenodomus tracheiphilus IPT5]
MSSTCALVSEQHLSAIAINNVSALFEQRYADSAKEDRERLRRCWGYTDCGDCHRSAGHCGWCAMSWTCLPLPRDPISRAFPLLSPIRYDGICALASERFELRTSGLGCQVSTITFLTSIVTILSTVIAIAVLYRLANLFKVIAMALGARTGGYVLYGDGSGEIWVRKSEAWSGWWSRWRREQSGLEVEDSDGGHTPQRFETWQAAARGGNPPGYSDERTRSFEQLL